MIGDLLQIGNIVHNNLSTGFKFKTTNKAPTAAACVNSPATDVIEFE